MPIHDWAEVKAGIFHHFHHEWISSISRRLNSGVLPPNYYALAEQITGGLGPNVVALEIPTNGTPRTFSASGDGGVALQTAPPRVRFHVLAEIEEYAKKAKSVTIRHVSDHRVVAIVAIVSPGNKQSVAGLRSFVTKVRGLLDLGIHVLAIDLFPPSPRDPQSIHSAIWEAYSNEAFILPIDQPLTLASYVGNRIKEAFIEPVAVGGELPEMPLYLESDGYILVPLQPTYQQAWVDVPAVWRQIIEG